jgi:long-chain fatty acid transport protein
MLKIFSVIVSVLLLFTFAFSGGFELYEFGARSSSMGGAVVARAADASTVFYNPAGIVFLEGTNFYGGVTLISTSNSFTWDVNKVEYEAKSGFHTPIGVYFTHRFNEKLAAGIGVTNPFGLGLEWDEDFPVLGRAISRNSDLKSYYISPVVAYQVMEGLSIGAGPDFVLGSVTLESAVWEALNPLAPNDRTELGTAKIEGSSKLAVGFSASAMYRAEKWGAGVLYRHTIKNKLEDGDLTFKIYDPYGAIPAIQMMMSDRKINAEMNFPAFLSIGFYYKLLEQLGMEVDYMWYKWSEFDKIVIKYPDGSSDEIIEDYKNSEQIRVGLHYDLSPLLQLRLGYIFDQTPQPTKSISPMLPDNDRNDFSIGLGYTYNKMQFDIGYMMVLFGERDTKGRNAYLFEGIYKSTAHLFFISYGIKLK